MAAPRRAGPLARRLGGPLLGAAAALPLLVYLRGFTVDDALIPARYAAHVARGLGYRFNARGASTDGVTPLGWVYLLAPFAGGGPLAALHAARAMGAAAWMASASALGAAIQAMDGSRWRYASLFLVLGSAPLAAWSVAGLETGIVTALAAAAAVVPATSARASLGAALAGACAWLRPEMIVYAACLAVGRARTAEGPRAKAWIGLFAIAPWCAAALLRAALWGRPAPLAVLAKPSDLAHGLAYVVPALVLTGAPLAAVAPVAWRALPAWPRVLALAALAHFGAVAIAGGDWMPLARLLCPVLPSLVVVTAHLLAAPAVPYAGAGARAGAWSLWPKVRLTLACAGQIALLALRGPAAARVMADRMALIDAARPELLGAERVAAVDVGWVGAATDAEIIDLAGLTDPDIAALPGGHTSKGISGVFLSARRPDKLVFRLAGSGEPSPAPRFALAVDARLASDPLIARAFRETWRSPPRPSLTYAIWSRISARAADPADPPP